MGEGGGGAGWDAKGWDGAGAEVAVMGAEFTFGQDVAAGGGEGVDFDDLGVGEGKASGQDEGFDGLAAEDAGGELFGGDPEGGGAEGGEAVGDIAHGGAHDVVVAFAFGGALGPGVALGAMVEQPLQAEAGGGVEHGDGVGLRAGGDQQGADAVTQFGEQRRHGPAAGAGRAVIAHHGVVVVPDDEAAEAAQCRAPDAPAFGGVTGEGGADGDEIGVLGQRDVEVLAGFVDFHHVDGVGETAIVPAAPAGDLAAFDA